MLHPVKDCPKGRVQWCGPTSLAALTGISYMDALVLLKSVRVTRGATNPVMKGVTVSVMRAAFDRLGYLTTPVRLQRGQHGFETFAAFLRRREGALTTAPLLINVTRHFLVAEGRKALDTKSKGEPVFISKIGYRRARMEGAWTVRPTRTRSAAEQRALVEKALAEARRVVERAEARRRHAHVASDDYVEMVRTRAKESDLKVTVFASQTGCSVRSASGRPFHWGAQEVFRGPGWAMRAYDFCLDFGEDMLDWNWQPEAA